MDRITLTGIKCYGYTGLFVEEQILGQWFEVDVTMYLNLEKAGKSDNIHHTLDYRSVIAEIKDIIKNSKFYLVEKLADTLVNAVLNHDLVRQVDLKLSKLAAPIPDFGGKITIELSRSKL